MNKLVKYLIIFFFAASNIYIYLAYAASHTETVENAGNAGNAGNVQNNLDKTNKTKKNTKEQKQLTCDNSLGIQSYFPELKIDKNGNYANNEGNFIVFDSSLHL